MDGCVGCPRCPCPRSMYQEALCAHIPWQTDRKAGRLCAPCPEDSLGGAELGVKGIGSRLARGGEPSHDATATISPFWNGPSPREVLEWPCTDGGGGGSPPPPPGPPPRPK